MSGILRDIKGYWGIFRHIETNSELWVTLAYRTMPYSGPWPIYQKHLQKPVKKLNPLSANSTKWSNALKKTLIFSISGLHFLFWEYLGEKKCKMFYCRTFFLVFLTKRLSKFLSYTKPSLLLKFLTTSALRYDAFCKNATS